MARAQCKIEGCTNESRGRGWCSNHWLRWRKYGDPEAPPRHRVPPNKRQDHCDVEWCPEPHHARGYCSSHHAKLKKYGNPEEPPRTPPGRPARGGIPGYDAIHRRLRRLRGAASDHVCIACGKQAREWAYQGGDPDELTTDPTVGRREHPGLKYSTNLDLYQPMCVRCHRWQDAARRAA